MPFSVHIARVGVFNVDDAGTILKKDDPEITISQQLRTSIDHLVLVDSAIPNTTGNPTTKAYLELEATDDFVVHHMDQSTIITYLRTAGGGFG